MYSTLTGDSLSFNRDSTASALYDEYGISLTSPYNPMSKSYFYSSRLAFTSDDNSTSEMSSNQLKLTGKTGKSYLAITATGLQTELACGHACFIDDGGTYDLNQKLDISAAITDAEITELFS